MKRSFSLKQTSRLTSLFNVSSTISSLNFLPSHFLDIVVTVCSHHLLHLKHLQWLYYRIFQNPLSGSSEKAYGFQNMSWSCRATLLFRWSRPQLLPAHSIYHQLHQTCWIKALPSSVTCCLKYPPLASLCSRNLSVQANILERSSIFFFFEDCWTPRFVIVNELIVMYFQKLTVDPLDQLSLSPISLRLVWRLLNNSSTE